MSGFFKNFPIISYDMNSNGQAIASTNIMLRFRFREIILKYTELMFEYVIGDGEKPLVVADKFYGRPDLAEIILLTNKIIDPYYDWPMSYEQFNDYLVAQYGSIHNATQNIHSYWMIIQPRSEMSDGTIIEERRLRVDETTYLTLTEEERISYTYFDWEMEANEAKRKISLIKKSYMSQIETELKSILT